MAVGWWHIYFIVISFTMDTNTILPLLASQRNLIWGKNTIYKCFRTASQIGNHFIKFLHLYYKHWPFFHLKLWQAGLDIAALSNLCVCVWNQSKPPQVNMLLHLTLFSFLHYVWYRERREITGDVVPELSGFCGSYVNGTLYIFAGCNSFGYTNDVGFRER